MTELFTGHTATGELAASMESCVSLAEVDTVDDASSDNDAVLLGSGSVPTGAKRVNRARSPVGVRPKRQHSISTTSSSLASMESLNRAFDAINRQSDSENLPVDPAKLKLQVGKEVGQKFGRLLLNYSNGDYPMLTSQLAVRYMNVITNRELEGFFLGLPDEFCIEALQCLSES
jgi:hypothetical protein